MKRSKRKPIKQNEKDTISLFLNLRKAKTKTKGKSKEIKYLVKKESAKRKEAGKNFFFKKRKKPKRKIAKASNMPIACKPKIKKPGKKRKDIKAKFPILLSNSSFAIKYVKKMQIKPTIAIPILTTWKLKNVKGANKINCKGG